jgi:hypothetical protein
MGELRVLDERELPMEELRVLDERELIERWEITPEPRPIAFCMKDADGLFCWGIVGS